MVTVAGTETVTGTPVYSYTLLAHAPPNSASTDFTGDRLRLQCRCS